MGCWDCVIVIASMVIGSIYRNRGDYSTRPSLDDEINSEGMMSVEVIIAGLDEEIARLTKVRDLLRGGARTARPFLNNRHLITQARSVAGAPNAS